MQKQQLSQLLTESDNMTQQLLTLRNHLLSNTVSQNYQKSSETIIKAIHHRTHLRTLADTLEANRNMVQLKKEKIEKSRIVLEGLDYFKKTLKDKIAAYHTDVDTIDEYLDEPVGPIDWENDYEAGEARLKASLEKLKAKDQIYRNGINRKNQMLKTMEEKKKLYNVIMPKHIKKLTQHVQQVSKIFGIEANQVLQTIESPKLAYIYDSFKTLTVAQKIQVKYSKQQHESVDIVVKPIGLQLYQRASQYNIKLQQKQVKIKICSLKPDLNKLVIGVDRRSDFSNRDLFHRLINHEDIKSVIEDPSTEAHRNLNNKFVVLGWIEDALSVSSIKCAQFVLALRNRVFVSSLIKHLFEPNKNPHWLSTIAPPIYQQLSNKRFQIQSITKITFSDYKALTTLPTTLRKSLNTYEQSLRKPHLSIDEQLQLKKAKSKLLQVLTPLGLEELIVPDLYAYQRVVVGYRGLRVCGIVMLPYEYPNMAPKIKIVQFQRTTQQQQTDSIPTSLYQSVQCKAKLNTIGNLNTNSKPTSTLEIETLEKQANLPYSALSEGMVTDPFRVVYYLSKFYSALYGVQNGYLESHKSIK